MESSVSAYVAESYEGLDTAFSEVSQLPSRGYCDLYRVKRFLFGEQGGGFRFAEGTTY